MRDSQKQKCYNWQYKIAGRPQYTEHLNNRLTKAQAQALANKICNSHGVQPPIVEETWAKSKSYFQSGHMKFTKDGIRHVPSRIKLSTSDNRWGFKLLVVLHEIAHALGTKYVKNEPSHGPTYMRLFYDLLVKFGRVNGPEARQLAREMGVKIGPAIDYVLDHSIKGVIPTPVTEKPKIKERKIVKKKDAPGVPWLRASTPEEKSPQFWMRCVKCKELIVFDEQPLGFQWCESCQKKKKRI